MKLHPNRGCDHWGWYNESDYNESNDNKDKDNDDKCKYWRSAKDRNYRKGMTKWETMTTKTTAIYRSW